MQVHTLLLSPKVIEIIDCYMTNIKNSKLSIMLGQEIINNTMMLVATDSSITQHMTTFTKYHLQIKIYL